MQKASLVCANYPLHRNSWRTKICRHGSILQAGHDRYWTFCLPTKLIAKFTFLPPAAAANESLRPELQEYAGDQIIILSHSLAQSDTIRNHSLYRNTNSLTKGFESCQRIRDTLVIFFHTAFLNVYAKICHWVMIEFLKRPHLPPVHQV